MAEIVRIALLIRFTCWRSQEHSARGPGEPGINGDPIQRGTTTIGEFPTPPRERGYTRTMPINADKNHLILGVLGIRVLPPHQRHPRFPDTIREFHSASRKANRFLGGYWPIGES